MITILVLLPLYANILDEYPIIVEKSDIYPTIKICVDRFLNGEPVYAPDYSFGYYHYPNYLPGKWLPFVIAEVFNFDYRWIPFAVLCFGLFFYFKNLSQKAIDLPILLVLSLAPGLMLLYYHLEMPLNLGYTVEIMDLGIHLFLFISILSGGVVARSLSISWVLLSRYSLVLWLPVFLLGLFFKEDKRNAILTGVFIALGICVCYIFPFLSQDWHSFSLMHESYLAAAKGSWGVLPQPGKIVPHVMEDQVGFASFFYVFAPGDILERINLLRIVHFTCSLSVAIILGLMYLKFHSRIRPKYFFLCGLKVYLMVFYAFLQVPFFYLFITPTFLSLVLLQEMTMGDTPKSEA
ncbi:MAG: hypothetical protein AAGI38_19110 [Bacteroidota bacterium]